MSVFSLIQTQVTDQQPPVYNDVVFVIDTSSSLSPSFSYLLDEYLVKIIRYFTGFINDPKVFCESKEAYTQFGIVLVVPTETPTVPLIKKIQATSSTGLVVEYLKSLVFEGAGFEYFSLSDGLIGAIDIFRNLQSHQDLRPGVHEKYCVVVSNKPHHTLPYSKGSEFNGFTVSDITSYLKKQQIKLSVVSPRRIPELKSLYEQALLSPDLSTMDVNKQYKHLVMLQGIDMQSKGDQMNTILTEDQHPPINPNDLTDTMFAPFTQMQHPPNPNTIQMRDQHTLQQIQMHNNIIQQNIQPSPYHPQTLPQQSFHEQQPLQTQPAPPPQPSQPQPQTLPQQQIQQPQQQPLQPYQQCPSPVTFKSSPKTSPSMANFANPSPNYSNPNSAEANEPPPKKVCVDDPSNSPSMMQSAVPPPVDIKSEIDVKPNINHMSNINNIGQSNFYNMPPQATQEKDVKPIIDDYKPGILPNLNTTSPPGLLDTSKSGYPGMMPANPANAANCPPSQNALQTQPIDIVLEEVSRAPMGGGGYSQVKGRVTFQHQCLIPDGFPKKWLFKTSPPIVYLREILFSQSESNQFGNNDRGLIYGSMQILDNPNRLPCLQGLTENKMCLFLYHHRVQTTNFQINFQMLIVKLNERVDKSTLTVLYPVDKRFYQRFSEVMKKGQQHKQPIPRMMPGLMSRSIQPGMGLDQLASGQMTSTNPMAIQGGVGGSMGMMPVINQMGNTPGGYNSGMMGANMGSSVQGSGNMMNPIPTGNNGNGNGQGNGNVPVSGAAASDISGATSVGSQMGNSNNLMNMTASTNNAMMSSANSTMMSSASNTLMSSGANTMANPNSDIMSSGTNTMVNPNPAMISSGASAMMNPNNAMMSSGANSDMMGNTNSAMMGNTNSAMMSNTNSAMMGNANNPMMISTNNPMMSSGAPNMGMGGGMMNSNPAYPVPNPGGMGRSQVGDPPGFNQASGSSSVNNSLALLLHDKGDMTKPSLRPQMGNRNMRPQVQQQMLLSQMGNSRGMMHQQQQQRYAQQPRRPMMTSQQMMGGQPMMSGMENQMMMGLGPQGMGQMGQDRMQGMPGMAPPQAGMLQNPGMQKQNPMQHYMKN